MLSDGSHVHALKDGPDTGPKWLCADRGYTYDKHHRLLRSGGITPEIAW